MVSSQALLLLLALIVLAQIATAKRTAGTITMSSGKVHPIGKFSFRPGSDATVTGITKFRGDPRGTIYLFMDTEWEKFHANNNDCSRMSFATASFPIGGEERQHGKGLRGKGWLENLSLNTLRGDQKEWEFTWKITHYVRTYGYYLVIADCDNAPVKKYKQVEYDINFFNDNGNDHFPADEHGLFTLYIVTFLGLLGFMVVKYKERVVRASSAFSEGPPSAAVTLLGIGYVCELLSVLLEILHLWMYSSNGQGFFFFDFMSEVLEGTAQTALSYLLLAFAGGWTIIEGAVTAKSEAAINPEALGEDHPSTMFVALMTILTVLLQLLNKLVLYDDFTKFHDNESWPGFILVMVRIMLAMFFTYQIGQTLSFMQRRGGKGGSTLRFMKMLGVFGGLWFWVFPFLVMLASVFAHYLRHRLVAGGTLILQSACLVILTREITAEKSSYSKASTHGGVILGESSRAV